MKVLQINANYGFGSTGIIVKDIGDTLKNNGDEPYYAYQFTNCEVENGYKIGNKIDYKWHALYTRIFGKQAYASKIATKKFLKWVDKIKPDVIHFHNLHSNYVNLNLILDYVAKNKIKTAITLHDCWFFTGKCSHYVEEGCDKWQNSCGNCPRNKKEVKSLFFDATSKVLKDKTDRFNKIEDLTIVGCSEWIAGEVKKSKLKPKKVAVIRNGVDIAIFNERESSFRKDYGLNDEFVVLGLASKWYDDINREDVKKLINDNADIKFIMLGVNYNSKEFFSSFENVISLGYIKDRERLAEIYSASDVFVNLTHADTLPTVNMESVCSGTPVITFDACGSPELIEDGVTGFIVKEGDFIAINEKINYLKQNPLSFDLSKQQAKFNKNETYKKYLDIYKD